MNILAFNKERTNVIKGVAILMMIWLHAFGDVSQYHSLFNIAGKPLAAYLVNACNPVGLFMVVSGYGMYFSYKKAENQGLQHIKWQHSLSRIIRLYIPYWIATILAMVICQGPSLFVTYSNIPEDISNIFAYNPTFNLGGWYIAPFVLTSLLIDRIFRWFDNYDIPILIFGLLYYYGMAHAYGLVWDYIHVHRTLLIFCRISEFFLPMVLGASMAKHSSKDFTCLMNTGIVSALAAVGVILCFVYCSFFGMPIYPIYCALLVLLIANARISKYTECLFSFLGKHSMNMWFIHGYFIAYSYKVQYPVLILICDVLISLLLSYVVDFFAEPIVKKINSKLMNCSSK